MSPATPTPFQAPALPPPVQAVQGAKPAKKPAQPTFLGAGATPSMMGGLTGGGGSGKTLLGQ